MRSKTKTVVIIVLLLVIVAGAVGVYLYLKPSNAPTDETPSGSISSGEILSGDGITSGSVSSGEDNVASGEQIPSGDGIPSGEQTPSGNEIQSGDVGSGDVTEPEPPTEPEQPDEPVAKTPSVAVPFKYNVTIKDTFVVIPNYFVESMEDGTVIEFNLYLEANEGDEFDVVFYSFTEGGAVAGSEYVAVEPIEGQTNSYHVSVKYVEGTLIGDQYFVPDGLIFTLKGNSSEYINVFFLFYYNDTYVVM